MAAYAKAATDVVANYQEGGHTGKRLSVFELQLVLATQGGATNNIPASTWGLKKIVRSSVAVLSDNTKVVPTSPSADGSLLLFGGGASNAPADYTGTFNVTIWGQM